ncbi:von Willebrand factor A domain-containing protein 7-like [Anticarsia gemmatalis]|uniref:von Willebrand factor A domain-containing protein 7-like n=1 Tax=Anticarsia gemmatalis TaxID=129554 RepID=UPI003F768C79
MWVYPHVIVLIITNILEATWADKGSLAFAIDNTISMSDSIEQIKLSAEKIAKVVLEEKSSQIKNMVLVTFNDINERAKVVTTTNDRDIFKNKLYGIRPHSHVRNDCPELSMEGTLLALNKSLPGSFIYVFTDASAKDYKKSEKIKDLCQKKQSQV